MDEIRFYHLQNQTIEQGLPALLSKIQEIGKRALVKVPDRSYMDTLDKVLWEFDPASFLPHDKDGSKHPEEQAVFLTLSEDNPNSAEMLVLIDAVQFQDIMPFDRCLYMFDGRNEATVEQARGDWKKYKDAGVPMSYWQQGERGGWEKKL